MLAVMNDSGGAPGPERAFITRLTGGRQAGRAASGRARKEAEARATLREVYSSPVPGSSRLFTWYLTSLSSAFLLELAVVAEFG